MTTNLTTTAQARPYIVGFYDADGVFFTVAEENWGRRGNFDLARGPYGPYVGRFENPDGGAYVERDLSEEEARTAIAALEVE